MIKENEYIISSHTVILIRRSQAKPDRRVTSGNQQQNTGEIQKKMQKHILYL